MYLLYPVEYPARSLAASAFAAAMKASGLAKASDPAPEADLDAAKIRALFENLLRDAGATPVNGRTGSWEVPDSALTLLEQLEAFYHRLYPETAKGGSSQHFYYEQLEWLGQY